MKELELTINGKKRSLDVPGDMPLLWALRDILRLTGTKYGCGLGVCGICTVHLEGEAIRSCQVSCSSCEGKDIRTIEGLSEAGTHPVQIAWKEACVPQCGYCQSGQMMQAAALLKLNPTPSEKEIEDAMSKVLCRCGTYPRIKKALSSVINQPSHESKLK